MLLKIVVTDSGGVEHVFIEDQGETENYVDLNPEGTVKGAVKVTTRTFDGEDKFSSEVESVFIFPRRIDFIYGEYEEEKDGF